MIHQAVVARDIMTTNLVVLSPQADVFSAINVLLKKRISGAPVVDLEGNFLGIFSERSCMEVIVNALYDGMPDAGLMPFVDTNPPTVAPDTDLLTICQTFLDQAVRRLPVLEQQQLVGQISRRDVMRYAAERLAPSDEKHPEPLYLSAVAQDCAEILSRIT